MKRIRLFIAALAVATLGAVSFAPVYSVQAAGPLDQICQDSGATDNTVCKKQGSASVQSTVQIVINVALFIIGAISVVMIIWSGIRFTASAGNSAAVNNAKNTLMYSIIGLIVAFLAFAIVNWVSDLFV